MAYAEIGFSGVIPKDGSPPEEIAAFLAELHAIGGLPTLDKSEKS